MQNYVREESNMKKKRQTLFYIHFYRSIYRLQKHEKNIQSSKQCNPYLSWADVM